MSPFAVFMVALAIVVPIIVVLCNYIFRGSFLQTIANIVIALAAAFVVIGYVTAMYGIKVYLIGAAVIAPAAIFGFAHIKRTIQGAIKKIASSMGKVAEGDLSIKMEDKLLSQRNEIGILATNFDKMADAMRAGIMLNEQNGRKVVEASRQFSTQAGNISHGASTQAASAEEISASMEQTTANIMQNLDNAREGAVISSQVDKEIGQVSAEFDRTAASMKEIEGKIEVVGDIAQKTNILAINAAIEAARAGEHGRGFAVVAAEVRRLADLSAKSAQEIEGLSKQSASAVANMGEALTTSIPNIRKISSIIQEIASASQEQQTGTEQIGAALDQLVQITNENSSSAQELSSTSESLATMAAETQADMARYKLN